MNLSFNVLKFFFLFKLNKLMNRKNRNKKNKIKKINGPEKLKIKINLYSLKLNANQFNYHLFFES